MGVSEHIKEVALEAAEDGFIDAKALEAAGFKVDKYGNKFAIPNENVVDLDDLGLDSGYIFPKPEEGFKFFICRKNEVTMYIGLGARPVERTEIEIPEEMRKQYGSPVTTLHEMYDAVLMKCTTELFDLMQERKNRVARARFKEINDVDKTRRQIEEDGNFQVRVTHSRTTTKGEEV